MILSIETATIEDFGIGHANAHHHDRHRQSHPVHGRTTQQPTTVTTAYFYDASIARRR